MTWLPNQSKAFAVLIIGAISIGLAPILVKLSPLGPVGTGFWRIALALPIILLWRRPHTFTLSWRSIYQYRYAFLAGLFFAGDLATWHLSLRFTSVTSATLLVNLAPIIVCFAGWLWLEESLGRRFLWGLLLALSGTWLITGYSFVTNSVFLLGDILSLVAAFFLAGYLFCIKKARRTLNTFSSMIACSAASAIALYCLAFTTEPTILPDSLATWGILLLLAGLPQAIGQSAITYALADLPVGFSSLVLLLQPITAALIAWPILGESITLPQIIGGIIVLAGIHFARTPL